MSPAEKKITVEECLVLDAFQFTRQGFLSPDQAGTFTWRVGETIVAQVWWRFEDDIVYLPLIWRGDIVDTKHHGLEVTRVPGSTYGGQQVRFVCAGCLKSVRKLYLPPYPTVFLCGSCHSLTYRSSQKRQSVDEKVNFRLPKLFKEFNRPGIRRARRVRAMERIEEIREEMDREMAKMRKPRPPAKPAAQAGLISWPEWTELQPAPFDALLAGEPPAPPPPKRPRGRPREKRPYHRHEPLVHGERTGDTQAYCVKCRDFREMENVTLITFSNGRPALSGRCPVCGCRLARVVKGKTQPQGH